jgi:hypothetical protein
MTFVEAEEPRWVLTALPRPAETRLRIHRRSGFIPDVPHFSWGFSGKVSALLQQMSRESAEKNTRKP